MNERGEIIVAPPRQNQATQPIGEALPAAPARSRPVIVEVGAITVQIYPDDAVIVTVAGDATASVRSGQSGASLPLGRTQVIVRLDPAPSSSRATELVK